jgi:hypothetical protein
MEKSIKTIKRNKCAICDDVLDTVDFALDNFPIYMGTTLNPIKQDKTYNQKWAMCENCGCIQLTELLSLAELYSKNHHSEVVGNIWIEHHISFAKFISSNAPKNIIEIGGAHGYLATLIIKELKNTQYTMVEPDTNLVSDGITVIKGYIEDHIEVINGKDSIIHSHVLEHVYEPIDFLSKIVNEMKPESNMYISFPNIMALIRAKGANSLNFEHTYLLLPEQIESIFNSLGLAIVNKMSYLEHSFFYHLKKVGVKSKMNSLPNISEKSKQFITMITDLRSFVSKVNEVVKNLDVPVFLFGAHVFSQTLVVLGLDIERIYGIIDNAESKQNQRLYGTKLLVYPPQIIAEFSSVYVVLKASHYQEEIKSQLLEINPNTIVLE